MAMIPGGVEAWNRAEGEFLKLSPADRNAARNVYEPSRLELFKQGVRMSEGDGPFHYADALMRAIERVRVVEDRVVDLSGLADEYDEAMKAQDIMEQLG